MIEENTEAYDLYKFVKMGVIQQILLEKITQKEVPQANETVVP